MLHLALLRLFRKEKGKYIVTLINRCSLILPPILHKIVLCRRFLKLSARIPFHLGDSPSVVFLYLCVNFHKYNVVLALHFNVKFDQFFVQRVLRSRLTSNLQI